MKKVVHYIPGLINGGIEAMLLNYYKKINNYYKFIIVVHGQIEKSCSEKFEKLGAKVYSIPHWKKNLFAHNKELSKILKNEKPDIFHSHHGISNFFGCYIAKKCGISIRISHCHAYFPDKTFKQKIYSFFSNITSTNYAACGIGAAKYLNNNKNVKIIYNAVDVKKFKYSINSRNIIRAENNWQGKIVYGNVGRFSVQKNQLFLVDIYERLFKLDNNSRFVIIGGNDVLFDEVVERVNSSMIKNVCLILKDIKNVNEYYSAFDMLVLPSLYEGFPVAVIEAQISGLPCILSPTIFKEIQSDSVYYTPNLQDIDSWVSTIKKVKIENRKSNDDVIKKFDINKSYIDLLNYYDGLIDGRRR